MKKLFKLAPIALFGICLVFNSCSEEDGFSQKSQDSNYSLAKTSINLTNDAKALLSEIHSAESLNFVFNEELSITSKDNRDYKTFVFSTETETFSVSYDVLKNKFVYANRFFKLHNGLRDILLTDLESNQSITIEAMSKDVKCNKGESCAGCHYRVMKEIINSNGDAMVMCDLLDIAFICSAQTYIAATIHCWLQH